MVYIFLSWYTTPGLMLPIRILLMLTRKLLNQEFLVERFRSSLQKFFGHSYDGDNWYEISISQLTIDLSSLCNYLIMAYLILQDHWILLGLIVLLPQHRRWLSILFIIWSCPLLIYFFHEGVCRLNVGLSAVWSLFSKALIDNSSCVSIPFIVLFVYMVIYYKLTNVSRCFEIF